MRISDRQALRQQLRQHEGWERFPYRDTVGKLSIGCGRNLDDRGLSDEEIAYLQNNDINECFRQLDASFPWFFSLDVVRQRVLVDLCFMGIGTLRGFVKMLAAMERHDWATASEELLASRYATQTKGRAITLAEMLRPGEAA